MLHADVSIKKKKKKGGGGGGVCGVLTCIHVRSYARDDLGLFKSFGKSAGLRLFWFTCTELCLFVNTAQLLCFPKAATVCEHSSATVFPESGNRTTLAGVLLL